LPSLLLRTAIQIRNYRGPITVEGIDVPLARLARLFD
jgi:hypothetical protein